MGKEAKLKAVDPPKLEAVALPTQIDASELAYQQHLIAKIRSEQQAHQHELSTWSTYLATRYQLGPNDRVQEDGRIIRQEASS